jgi:hypothetical protein
MFKKTRQITLCLLTASTSIFAGEMGSASNVPEKGLYIGLGGSYNSIQVDQSLNINGSSNNVYFNGDLIATGRTTGSPTRYRNTQSTFAPEAQLAYFSHFTNSEQLWGIKFLYQYLRNTSSNPNVNIPEVGVYNSPNLPSSSFLGNIAINAAEVSVNHELTLMPFIGHSFKNSFVYLGAGPSVFNIHSNRYGISGSANIEGISVGFANVPTYSSSKWMWGGAAEIGMAYYISPTWLVDFSYSYAITGHYRNNVTTPFSSSSSVAGDVITAAGTITTLTSQQVVAQGVKISVNKVFSI